MSSDHDSPAPADPQPHAETLAEHVAAAQKKKNLYLRITSSMPLLITVVVHLILIVVAGAVVVQQNIIGKKKTFEASAANEGAAKQIEHRLQVARRGGSSGASSSPVSANRIFSTAAGALAMPEMPDLPSMGAGGFGGFGGMGSGVGLGAGTGMATALGGGAGLGGRGFMSLSFLGTTSQNASNIVFVVDTSTSIMEPAKGGFRAFSIIREEIMRLVGRLPPSAQFNVVLYRGDDYSAVDRYTVESNLFRPALVPATSENKKEFFEWMAPVNTTLGNFGPYSASRRTPWRRKPLPPEAGVDPLFLPPLWSRALQAALEQQPDTIFVITSSPGRPQRRLDDETFAKREAEVEKNRADFSKELEKEGLTLQGYLSARSRALEEARRELAAANRKLVAAGKDPIIVQDAWKIFTDRATIAELKKHGIEIKLSRTGWSKKDGSSLEPPSGRNIYNAKRFEDAEWTELHSDLARLQRHLVPERATLNIFYFVGPTYRPDAGVTNLTSVAKRNGGTFQLLTTKRLEELKARDEEKK